MPTSRVRWFDAAKGYGFTASKESKDMFLPAQALSTGVTMLRKEARAEYSVMDDRRGPQAMDTHLIASAPSLIKATRPKVDNMTTICEGLIKMLDTAGNALCRHRYPSAADSKKLATLLRAVADQFDIQD